MGNEMGNRNVSGLQEEEKSGVEETEKDLVEGVCGDDEVKGENNLVPDVKDKDFHEKVVDELSGGGEVLGDGDSRVEKEITEEKGQDDDTTELKLSSQSVEMKVPKESDDAASEASGTQTPSSSKQVVDHEDDKPILDSNLERGNMGTTDHPIQEQITIEREETEAKGSTIDSTSSSNDVHPESFQHEVDVHVQVEPPVEASSVLPRDSEEKGRLIGSETTPNVAATVVLDSNDQDVVKKMEELLVEDGESQEKKCEVASVGEEGNGFPMIGSLDSSQEVCEPQDKPMGLTQEPKLLVKDAAQEENCEDASVGEEGNDFPLIGSLDSSEEVCEPQDKLAGLTQEPELLVKDAAQEENCEVASVDEEGNGFLLYGSLETSQEVCEPQDKSVGHPQETELMVKDGESQVDKCEVESVGEKGNGFPLIGSVDSSQEVSEPQDKLVGLTEEPKLSAQEEKSEVASVGEEGIGFPLAGSLDSSQEVCEPQDKTMGLTTETKLTVKDGALQDKRCEAASVYEERNGILLFGSIDSSREVFEPQDKGMGLTTETKLMVKDGASQEEKCEVASVGEVRNGILLFGSTDSSQEVFEPQDKSMGLPQETKLVAKDTPSQEGKCDIARVNENGNDFPLVGAVFSSQEVCEPQDGSIGLTQETKLTVKDSTFQEEKCEIGSVNEEGNDFPLFGSLDSSQEVSEPQYRSIGLPHEEVSVIVRELVTAPSELTVTDKNHDENKPKDEKEEKKEHISQANSTKQEKGFPSQSPNSQLHEGNTIMTPEGEKTTTKNSGIIIERKSPSFDFGLSLEARSQESDRTPLLCHDKAATRSLSSGDNLMFQNSLQQTYQYSKVPLEDEAVSVEEKTIMMERSYSEKSRAPFMSLLKKEEKVSNGVTTPHKEEGSVGYKKAAKEVMLTSPKGSNGKRKPMSSLFTTCICCDAAIL